MRLVNNWIIFGVAFSVSIGAPIVKADPETVQASGLINTVLRRSVKILERDRYGCGRIEKAALILDELVKVNHDKLSYSANEVELLKDLAHRAAETKAELKSDHPRWSSTYPLSNKACAEKEIPAISSRVSSRVAQMLKDYFFDKKQHLCMYGLELTAGALAEVSLGLAAGRSTDAIGRNRLAVCGLGGLGGISCGAAVGVTHIEGEVEGNHSGITFEGGIGLGIGERGTGLHYHDINDKLRKNTFFVGPYFEGGGADSGSSGGMQTCYSKRLQVKTTINYDFLRAALGIPGF